MEHNQTQPHTKHFYVNCECEAWRYETLCDLINVISVYFTLVFCNSGAKAEWLSSRLTADGYAASYIHNGHTDEETRVRLEEFNMGSTRILILSDSCTPVKALELSVMQLIIGYDIPRDYTRRAHMPTPLHRCCCRRHRTMITLVTNNVNEAMEQTGTPQPELQQLFMMRDLLGLELDECPSNIDLVVAGNA